MRDIKIQRDLPYPIELVWSAISESGQLSQWLMENDFLPVIGHAFTFKTDPAPGFDGIVCCKVLELEPCKRLVMSWQGGPLDTILSFDLQETPTGTRLNLCHSGFEGAGNLLPRFFLGLGWSGKTLKQLNALLAQRSGKN
jgi:uncharacterized protein YndB with AHSA1/START domain